MNSDIELETSRLIFEIEKELMLSQLRELLEKTMKIENILRESMKSESYEQENLDCYKPCNDMLYPPKKRVKFE